MEELDKAHADIARLLRLHKSNVASVSAHQDAKPGSHAPGPMLVRLTSRFGGLNALTHHMAEKNYDRAFVWASALKTRLKDNAPFVRALRDLQSKRGEISDALLLTYEAARLDRNVDPRSVRRLEGRLREVSGWTPAIPGRRVPIKDPIQGRIMHLVKESRPYLSNGFTSRSHSNFVAESKAGLDPIVVTEPGFPRILNGKPFRATERVDGVRHVRLDVGEIDYAGMPVDEFLQMFAQLAYEEVLKYRPSVIHASSGRRGYDTALVGLALQEKTGLPFVYEVRSFFEGNWTGDLEWEAQGETFSRRMWVEEMCMRRADRVLTIGEAMKDELISRGIPADKIGIIPNAVDADAFSPRERSLELAGRHGIGSHPTFGYVSNMDHYRESQETLIQACRILKDAGSEARCVLVGGGPRKESLVELAAHLGVSDRVIFTGPVDHAAIPDYYSLIDIFVVPRIPERAATYVTPLKPFEAMALRKPIVVSDLPALVEIVDPPLRGTAFPAGEADMLAALLLRLYEDPDECERMAAAGHDWVRTSRTWDKNGERYVEEFAGLREGASAK
ncbi:glycosyltransferase family 4 protein [Arthrobacter sp. OVS8]|nr:glycosyltransferase family 4 protein [Arthrobacter sp. OVS8]